MRVKPAIDLEKKLAIVVSSPPHYHSLYGDKQLPDTSNVTYLGIRNGINLLFLIQPTLSQN